MKILILTNKPPYPPKDGGAIATSGIAGGLAEAGNHIHIIAINTPKHFSNTFSDHFNISLDYIWVDTSIKPLKAIYNFLFSREPYNAIRFYNYQYAEKLSELLQVQEFDIIQLEGPYMFYYLDIIRKNSKALVSFRAHNIEHEIWQRLQKGEGNLLKRFYINNLANRIKRFEQKIINKYDLLVPITERDALVLNQMGNTKPSHIAPAGINEAVFNYKADLLSAKGLFYIGALDWKPNTEGLKWFIENVWSKISNKFPDETFSIAGRNAPIEFVDYLKKKNVDYLGEIDDAYSFISKMNIQVVPLFSGSGMRIKIVEGMALGKAIISTSIGVEGIAANHKENIMIANTANEFAENIMELLDNVNLQNQISQNAIQFAMNHYSNTQIGLALSAFYHKFIKK